jgi:hypothetical protein
MDDYEIDGEENFAEDDAYDMDSEYNDSMDGDHDSAMASAGWGTDESYGCYDDGGWD